MSSPAQGKHEGSLSPNRSSRCGRRVALVILHYTGMKSAPAALQRLCDPSAKVGAHYLIYETGEVLGLVPEAERAWHAGRSFWAGDRGINAASIGIELAHRGHVVGVPGYPEAQVVALEALLADILLRRRIGPAAVLGHSDVAPTRKRDPGEWFPWNRLAANGLAVWTPGPSAVGAKSPGIDDTGRMIEALERIGYDTGRCGFRTPVSQASFRAFQRRFRPWELGQPLNSGAILHAEEIAEKWPGAAVMARSHDF